MLMPPQPAVILHLHIRPLPHADGRLELLAFLRLAKAYYESPGGIRMRLFERGDDPESLIEVFEYDTVEAYEADERRVNDEPQMQALLAAWRSLLDGPPRIEVYRAVPV
jgi:quinol monooxygenase YgiN